MSADWWKRALPAVGDPTLRQAAALRKEAEQVPKIASSQWRLLQGPAPTSSMMDCDPSVSAEINPFLPSDAFVRAFM